MYNPLKVSKVRAAICVAATVAAAPLFAGGASVPNTSTATTSLTALGSVPVDTGTSSSRYISSLGGGGSIAGGYNGPAAYSGPALSLSRSPVAKSRGRETTLNGSPALAIPATKGNLRIMIVMDEKGNSAVYTSK